MSTWAITRGSCGSGLATGIARCPHPRRLRQRRSAPYSALASLFPFSFFFSFPLYLTENDTDILLLQAWATDSGPHLSSNAEIILPSGAERLRCGRAAASLLPFPDSTPRGERSRRGARIHRGQRRRQLLLPSYKVRCAPVPSIPLFRWGEREGEEERTARTFSSQFFAQFLLAIPFPVSYTDQHCLLRKVYPIVCHGRLHDVFCEVRAACIRLWIGKGCHYASFKVQYFSGKFSSAVLHVVLAIVLELQLNWWFWLRLWCRYVVPGARGQDILVCGKLARESEPFPSLKSLSNVWGSSAFLCCNFSCSLYPLLHPTSSWWGAKLYGLSYTCLPIATLEFTRCCSSSVCDSCGCPLFH